LARRGGGKVGFFGEKVLRGKVHKVKGAQGDGWGKTKWARKRSKKKKRKRKLKDKRRKPVKKKKKKGKKNQRKR